MFSKLRLLNNSNYLKKNINIIKSKLFNNINVDNSTTKYNKELLDHIIIIKNNFKNSTDDEVLKLILEYRSIIEYRKYNIDILVNDLKMIDKILKTESTYNLFNRFLQIKRDNVQNNNYKKYYMTNIISNTLIGSGIGLVVYSIVIYSK
jgi:hypothetical protein